MLLLIVAVLQLTEVVKSIVRVVRVVHLLLQTSKFFQLTCSWRSEKNLMTKCFKSKNTFYFRKSSADIKVERAEKHLIIDLVKFQLFTKGVGVGVLLATTLSHFVFDKRFCDKNCT